MECTTTVGIVGVVFGEFMFLEFEHVLMVCAAAAAAVYEAAALKTGL